MPAPGPLAGSAAAALCSLERESGRRPGSAHGRRRSRRSSTAPAAVPRHPRDGPELLAAAASLERSCRTGRTAGRAPSRWLMTWRAGRPGTRVTSWLAVASPGSSTERDREADAQLDRLSPDADRLRHRDPAAAASGSHRSAAGARTRSATITAGARPELDLGAATSGAPTPPTHGGSRRRRRPGRVASVRTRRRRHLPAILELAAPRRAEGVVHPSRSSRGRGPSTSSTSRPAADDHQLSSARRRVLT